jgi:hypothetical protein
MHYLGYKLRPEGWLPGGLSTISAFCSGFSTLHTVMLRARLRRLSTIARSPARTTPSPPVDKADGEEPTLGSSELLLTTADGALATPGLTFADGHGLKGPHGKGRETRRMNLHQAIRDALG